MSKYVFTDIHGNYNLFSQIKNFLKEEDECFILGDVIDRGDDGYQILKEIKEDSRFTLLKGNHEDMFVRAAYDYFHNRENFDIYWNNNLNLWLSNGGNPTFRNWKRDNKNIEIIHWLNHLPVYCQYENYYLCHSGYYIDPNLSMNADDLRNILWDRNWMHCNMSHIPSGTIIVHGHTPTKSRTPQITTYNSFNNIKTINLDCGTAMTQKIYLYNLDTEEIILFENI